MKSVQLKLAVWAVSLSLIIIGSAILPAWQIPKLDSLKKKIDQYGVEKLLKGEPVITTSLADALTEVAFLDDYDPKHFLPLTLMPRADNGNFILIRPGIYEFKAQSYCLDAGTYAPSRGDGYLYAPLKGPRAEIVRHILERSVLHPEIPQQDIQVLLWAIVARTKVSDMTRKNQQTALKLLTPQEIFTLNGGALGIVPDDVLTRTMGNLPHSIQNILRAENQIRRLLTRADATFDQIEKIAVLTGDPAPGKGSREVPLGRWSYHPQKYFVRYFPSGYRLTEWQISVPGPLRVDRDSLGRITSLIQDEENRMDIEYDQAFEPLTMSGPAPFHAYAFRSLRYRGDDPKKLNVKVQAEWKDLGWSFVGNPAGQKATQAPPVRFSNLGLRLDRAKTFQKELETLSEVLKNTGSSLTADRLETIMSIAHIAEGLRDIISAEGSSEKTSSLEAYHFIKRAWMAALVELPWVSGGSAASVATWGAPLGWDLTGSVSWPGLGVGFFPNGRLFTANNPVFAGAASTQSSGSGQGSVGQTSSDVGMPGNTNEQRLGQSPRPPGKSPCSGNITMAIGDAKINGEPVSEGRIGDLSGAVVTTGRRSRVRINLPDGITITLGSNSSVDMTNICKGGAGDERSWLEIGKGFFFSLVAKIAFGGRVRPFEYHGPNAVDGSRGVPYPLQASSFEGALLASLSRQFPLDTREIELEGMFEELRPSEAELAFAEAAFFASLEPHDYVYVRVIKGTVVVRIADEPEIVVRSGKHIYEKLGRPVAPKNRDVVIRLDK